MRPKKVFGIVRIPLTEEAERKLRAGTVEEGASPTRSSSAWRRAALASRPLFGFWGWFALNSFLSVLKIWSLPIMGITIFIWAAARVIFAVMKDGAAQNT